MFNLLTLFLFFAFLYYFHKSNESRRNQKKFFDKLNFLWIENQKLKVKIKELQSYKNDVSKTFKILDTELNLINEQLKTRQETTNSLENSVSLLTPEILNNLMENINQEEVEPIRIVRINDYVQNENENENLEQNPIIEDTNEDLSDQERYREQRLEQYQDQTNGGDIQEKEFEEVKQIDSFHLHPFENDLSKYFINISTNNDIETRNMIAKEIVNDVINKIGI